MRLLNQLKQQVRALVEAKEPERLLRDLGFSESRSKALARGKGLQAAKALQCNGSTSPMRFEAGSRQK